MEIRAIANQRILYKKIQEIGSQFEVDEEDVQRMIEAKFICTLEDPAQPTDLEQSLDGPIIEIDETDEINGDSHTNEVTSSDENLNTESNDLTEGNPTEDCSIESTSDIDITESLDLIELEEKEKAIREKSNQLNRQEKELSDKERELRNRINMVVQKEKIISQREISIAYTKSILGTKKPFMNPIVRKGAR